MCEDIVLRQVVHVATYFSMYEDICGQKNWGVISNSTYEHQHDTIEENHGKSLASVREENWEHKPVIRYFKIDEETILNRVIRESVILVRTGMLL